MNDYKELIAHIQGDAAFRHIISECGADGRVWFDKRFICDYVSHLKYAIKHLVADNESYKYAMPTVDAEPVRHGHWVVFKDENGIFRNKCSACGSPMRKGYKQTNFCPQCGANMNGSFSTFVTRR